MFTVAIISAGCAVEASKTEKINEQKAKQSSQTATQNTLSANTIEIKPDSPADTVRVFYEKLRGKKFREAFFLTNLRPAIEGLTDDELKDLQVDFDNLAGQVPAQIEINGEIIGGENATVTANLPDGEAKSKKVQQINLRRENGVWIILTLDAEGEKAVKKEGKNYFFSLRMQTYQEEAQNTLEKIMKAQAVHFSQNQGFYADLPTLIRNSLISPDVQYPKLSGYKFNIIVSPDGKNYMATAEPLEYGKTGKLSFTAQIGKDGNPTLSYKDAGGKSSKN